MENWKDDQNKRAMSLSRVSSARQKDNTSHALQEQEIRQYCSKEGLDLIKDFNIVESAWDSSDRTLYNAAINWALKNNIKHVLFYMTDREARNLTDTEFNENLIRQGKIIIHYVRDGRVLFDGSSDADFMIRDFQAVQNKHFSRNLSAKVMDAMRMKAEAGWYPSNHLPLGYIHQRVRDEDGRERKRGTIVVPDSNPQRIGQVRREFELRATGLSYAQIREQIISEGYIHPAKIKNYFASAIEHRLKLSFYRGSFEWGGKAYKGKHELIIPKSHLQAADQSFRGRLQNLSTKLTGTFSGGWFHCAQCGCSVVYDPKTKAIKSTGSVTMFHYYHCTNGKGLHPTMKGMAISEEKLWAQLGNAVSAVSISEDFAKAIAEALNQTQLKARGATKSQISGFRDALKALDKRQDEIFDLYVDKRIDEPNYRRHSDRCKEMRLQYTRQLEEAQLAITDACLETAKSILELATNAKSLWISRSPQERKQYLEKILSNPVLDGTTVRYELRKPFAILADMNEKLEWRTR